MKDIVLRTVRMGEIRFKDLSIVLASDITLPGESHYSGRADYGGMSLYVVADGSGPCGLAFADCTQNALDKLADARLMDGFRVEPEDFDAKMDETGEYRHLGNNCAAYDLTVDYWCNVVALHRQQDVDFLLMLAEARGAKVDHLGQL